MAYRVKIEAMGLRSWSGVDVQLYQEVCVSGGSPPKENSSPGRPEGSRGDRQSKEAIEGLQASIMLAI